MILDFIKGVFEPASKLVDELHVSDEERLKLRNELANIQASMQAKSVELMAAEAKSDHFIVAAVRPICTLLLITLVIADGYGLAEAPAQVYSLAEVFISVYAAGRSGEKIVKVFKGK
jgi:hypothetical protein